MNSIELGCDARFENALMKRRGDAISVVDHGELSDVPVSPDCKEDRTSMRISCVAEELDNDVFS